MSSQIEEKSTYLEFTEITAFQRDTLAVIQRLSREDVDSYGVAIKQHLEDDYDINVNHGRLYSNLDTLVSEGFVSKEELDKRTNQYLITEKGKRAMEAYLRRRISDFGWSIELQNIYHTELNSFSVYWIKILTIFYYLNSYYSTVRKQKARRRSRP
jgi:DNA-binding PadR family transcriptional regulator